MNPLDRLVRRRHAAALLGIPEDASREEVRAAYLGGLKSRRPEREPEAFKAWREAYEILRDRGEITQADEASEASSSVTGGDSTQPWAEGPTLARSRLLEALAEHGLAVDILDAPDLYSVLSDAVREALLRGDVASAERLIERVADADAEDSVREPELGEAFAWQLARDMLAVAKVAGIAAAQALADPVSKSELRPIVAFCSANPVAADRLTALLQTPKVPALSAYLDTPFFQGIPSELRQPSAAAPGGPRPPSSLPDGDLEASSPVTRGDSTQRWAEGPSFARSRLLEALAEHGLAADTLDAPDLYAALARAVRAALLCDDIASAERLVERLAAAHEEGTVRAPELRDAFEWQLARDTLTAAKVAGIPAAQALVYAIAKSELRPIVAFCSANLTAADALTALLQTPTVPALSAYLDTPFFKGIPSELRRSKEATPARARLQVPSAEPTVDTSETASWLERPTFREANPFDVRHHDRKRTVLLIIWVSLPLLELLSFAWDLLRRH